MLLALDHKITCEKVNQRGYREEAGNLFLFFFERREIQENCFIVEHLHSK